MQSSHGEDLGIGDKIDGRYEILSVLGKGSMGVVYKTKDERLGRIVAIKTLRLTKATDDRSSRRFEREARVSCKLDHPNLITVHDFGHTTEGVPFLVMDFVSGVPLWNILRQERCLMPERAVFLFTQVCDGLFHAHQKGIIHRDLKPANLLIVKRENQPEAVKIVDLGVAKIVHQSEDDTEAITRTGEVCGSPIYLSPEQCMYEELDPRTDIYSLGVCLYESLTGLPPLRGESVYDTIYMHVHEMPRPFSIVAPDLEIPRRLEEVVFRCLAKQRNERYETMFEVKQELIAALTQEAKPRSSVHVMPPDQFFADRGRVQERPAPPPPAAVSNAAQLDKPREPNRGIAESARVGDDRQRRPSGSFRREQPALDDSSDSVPGKPSMRSTLWDTINRPVLFKNNGSILQIVVVGVVMMGVGAGAVHLWHVSQDKSGQAKTVPHPGLPSGAATSVSTVPAHNGAAATTTKQPQQKSGQKKQPVAVRQAKQQKPPVMDPLPKPVVKQSKPAIDFSKPAFDIQKAQNSNGRHDDWVLNQSNPGQSQPNIPKNLPPSTQTLLKQYNQFKNSEKGKQFLKVGQELFQQMKQQETLPTTTQQIPAWTPPQPSPAQPDLSDAEVLEREGRDAAQRGDWPTAINRFLRLHSQYPNDANYKDLLGRALHNHAVILKKTGKFEEARQYSVQAVALFPDRKNYSELLDHLNQELGQ